MRPDLLRPVWKSRPNDSSNHGYAIAELNLNSGGLRVFIRFDAASRVAKTYLNGQQLGEHRGAFHYELISQ